MLPADQWPVDEAVLKNLTRFLDTGQVPIPTLDIRAKIGYPKVRKNIISTFRLMKDVPRVKPVPVHDGVFCVVGYGPSLKQTWGGLVNELKSGSVVCSTSGAHDFLLSRGIIPHFHADMDPEERKAEFVKTPNPHITYLMASRCHPKAWEYLKGQSVNIWHMGDMGKEDKLIARLEPDAILQPGAQCIGLNAIVLGTTLGFRKFSVYGMDCSYGEGASHAGPHNGNHAEGAIPVWCGDKEYSSRPEWVQYARNFVEGMFPQMKGCSFAFHGEGLFQHYLKESFK